MKLHNNLYLLQFKQCLDNYNCQLFQLLVLASIDRLDHSRKWINAVLNYLMANICVQTSKYISKYRYITDLRILIWLST